MGRRGLGRSTRPVVRTFSEVHQNKRIEIEIERDHVVPSKTKGEEVGIMKKTCFLPTAQFDLKNGHLKGYLIMDITIGIDDNEHNLKFSRKYLKD